MVPIKPSAIPVNCLVVYKNHPARVVSSKDKIEIQMQRGASKLVRPKDIVLLHPGPVTCLEDLDSELGELEAAWELLAGTTTDLAEVAELAFGSFSPQAAWTTWRSVMDGLYFEGTPDRLSARSTHDVARETAEREARKQKEAAWRDFVKRVERGAIATSDADHFKEVEAVAMGQTNRSRLLKELGMTTSRENAHRLLLKLGVWDATTNPHPQRLNVATKILPSHDFVLPDETRADLTHLPAFAIDDRDNQDPDDAVSIDGHRIWVHVADVAAVIAPQSAWDEHAQERGTTLYLPEKTIPMLPPSATELLGLGLHDVSPAFSFGVDLDDDGAINRVEVLPSWVNVTRLNYDEADSQLVSSPLNHLQVKLQAFCARRLAQGATIIDLPEVKIRAVDGAVTIEPLPRSPSRNLVTEAMLLAGEAAAKFALQNGIPIPFTAQPPPDRDAPQSGLMDGQTLAPTMAEMFAMRKNMKPSQTVTNAQPHWGLGLNQYARTTSPLRRYQDLVVHQQIRAFLNQGHPMSPDEITQRVGAVAAVTSTMRQAERLSNQHWTLVYLLQNPDWSGVGTLVDRRGRRGKLILPELAMETQINLADDIALNAELPLRVSKIDLPTLTARFRLAS